MKARWWAAVLALLCMLPTAGCSEGASGEPERNEGPQVDLAAARSQLAAIANEELGATTGDAYTVLARPAARLVEATPETESRSHFGGRPVLDSKAPWPTWNDKPLSLLLVVDLDQLRPFETGLNLPTEGTLNFFYAAEQQPWGDDPGERDGWRVVHSPRTGVARATPKGVTEFRSVRVAFEQILTVPGWEEDAVTEISERDPDAFERLDDRLFDAGFTSFDSRLGGWPVLVQAPVQSTSAEASTRAGTADDEASWRLFAQIDTNEDAGWMWGDAGVLYFTMHADDIADQAYDQAWLVLQSG